MLFQQQLARCATSIDRIQALAGWIAGQIGADVNHATRGPARATRDDQHMVRVHRHPWRDGGCTTRHYDGEVEDVAVALNEQYQPRFAGDDPPVQPGGLRAGDRR